PGELYAADGAAVQRSAVRQRDLVQEHPLASLTLNDVEFVVAPLAGDFALPGGAALGAVGGAGLGGAAVPEFRVCEGELRLPCNQPVHLGRLRVGQVGALAPPGPHTLAHDDAVHHAVLGAARIAGVQVGKGEARPGVRGQHGLAVDLVAVG